MLQVIQNLFSLLAFLLYPQIWLDICFLLKDERVMPLCRYLCDYKVVWSCNTRSGSAILTDQSNGTMELLNLLN